MNDTVELDLRLLGAVLFKRIWIILLSAVIAGAVLLLYTVNFVTPQYKADVTMYVNNNSSINSQYISSSDLAVAKSLVETYTNIISSNTVLEKVAEETGLGITASQIRGMLSATAVGETEMFKVSILTPDPQMSMDIANVIAEVAPDEIARIIPGSSAKVVDYARIPNGRHSPSYTTSALLGFLFGGIVAIAVVLIQHMMDNRVQKEEDLELIYNAPVLGCIPEMSEGVQKKTARKVR